MLHIHACMTIAYVTLIESIQSNQYNNKKIRARVRATMNLHEIDFAWKISHFNNDDVIDDASFFMYLHTNRHVQ